MTVAYFVWIATIWHFFASDLAVNYVTFGSDHQKLVGNPNSRLDVTAALCSGTSILRLSTVTFLPIALKPQH